VGFPPSGFKPRRLSINPTLPENAPEVKHQVEWLAGTPLAKTRKSAFVRLIEQPLAA
jgi:hypothetical protein